MLTLNRPGNKDNDIQYMSLGKRYLANFIFIPAMLIILVISIYSYHVINSVMISQTWIAHTYKVMQAVDQSLYGIADIETHHRGFLITGDNQFYIDKQANINDLNVALKTLVLLTRDNAEQNIRSKHLADLIATRLDMFEVIMTFKKDNKLHTPEVMKIFYSNLKVENEIEATGKEIISIELTLLNERENAFNENTYKTNLILIAGSVTSLIFMFIAFLISNIAIHRQILAEKNRAILALQLREVIESASDMIAAIDINQRFFIFNESYQKEFKQLFGKQVTIGMSLHEAMEFAPAEKDKMIQSWEASLHGDESTRAVSFDVSGKQMTYEITANSIKDSVSIIGAIHIIRNITKRMNEQQELQQAYEKINHGMIDLQRSNEQITFLVEMSDLMLACNSVGELSDVVAKFCSKIFTLSSGMLYIMQPSKKYLEMSAQWGDIKSIENTIMTDQCWAIRLGRSHHAGSGKNELMCEHIKQQDNKTTYICVPLMAQNDIYGVLYLEIADANSAEFAEKEKLLLKAFSELTALALANVRLRENLRNQSIRDPLTGLYNRRYLDDFLSKLLYQSDRNGHHVVLLMLDIDYFKKVNDTHGHDAGDLVLKELSKVLEEEIRAGDLAARYGGEEFIIVFYNTTLDVATKRAEKIRQTVANLQIKQGTETLRITVSIGIAEFPTHAKTAADLISLSDKALYTAKNGGRNKIIVYTESVNKN